jgi:hypothetical protein
LRPSLTENSITAKPLAVHLARRTLGTRQASAFGLMNPNEEVL